MVRHRKSALVESSHHTEEERDEGDEDLPESQEEVLDALKAARNVMSVGKKRRVIKRKVNEDEHEKRVAEVKVRMEAFFEERMGRVAKLQNTQWDRLEALNKKRQHLEFRILESIKSIEQHTVNISTELAAMYGGKIAEIEDLSQQEA